MSITAAMSIPPAEVDGVLDSATKVIKRSYHPEGNTLTIENRNMTWQDARDRR
jgi:hypothetical protein